MKKKLVAKVILACATLLLAGTLTGCTGQSTEGGQSGEGQSTEATENTGAASGKETTPGVEVTPGAEEGDSVKRILMKDLDPNQYVSIGDYQSLRVAQVEPTVPENELQEEMWNQYVEAYPEELGVKDRAAQLGDAVNIDFEGKKDGVAFDGGTSQGYNLTLGSGSFINGFEDGLVGVMPGETVDLNLKFPDLYGNLDLAGQEVVFTVTVNYVIPAEMKEEVIQKLNLEGVTNTEEFRQYVYNDLYEYYQQTAAEEYENNFYNAFMALCEFQEVPEDYLNNTKARMEEYVNSAASQYGLDAETFVAYAYGTDLATFLDFYGEETAKQNMALYVVALNENLFLEDAELEKVAMEYAASYGFSNLDDYFTAIDASLEEFQEDYAVSMAYDRLLEIASQ